MVSKLLDAPMAMTSAGTVLAGITHLTAANVDPQKALEHALKSGRRIYIGVELTKREVAASKGRLDDALAEIVASVVHRERG